MRRILIALVASIAIALPAIALANGPTLHTAADECRASGGSEKLCRSLEAMAWGAGAGCRKTPADDAQANTCESIDGRRIAPAEIAAYQSSFTHQAHALQRGLSEHAALRDQQIVHTHNSFNSSSYFTTLTNQDPNQVYGITDQLDMDVRFLELDLHWVPSASGTAATNGYWVTLCHGNSSYEKNVHIGCTWDRPLQDGLDEIRTWLNAHPDEFVYLYLENQLSKNDTAHTVAAELLETAFGQKIYRPQAAPCADLPLHTSRAAMKSTGAQVILVGNCGEGDGAGTAWASMVHKRGAAWNESGGLPYDDADCAADSANTGFRRWFGDRTWLTAMTSASTDIDAANAARMNGCGVNIIGFDHLTPTDGKLDALVWSWAEAPSTTEDCVAQNDDGRFTSRSCTTVLRYACVTPAGEWAVTTVRGAQANGQAACAAEFAGSSYSVPVNALQNRLLHTAHVDETTADVWLDYRRIDGTWTPAP